MTDNLKLEKSIDINGKKISFPTTQKEIENSIFKFKAKKDLNYLEHNNANDLLKCPALRSGCPHLGIRYSEDNV